MLRFSAVLLLLSLGCASAPVQRPLQPARQNPSPMVDTTRAHYRLQQTELAGWRYSMEGLLPKPIEIFIPEKSRDAPRPRLLIHFMGATWLPMMAAAELEAPTVVAAVHLGAGSAINERPFLDDPSLFARMVEEIKARVAPREIGRIDLSAFSAGYGAVRAILSREENVALISGLLLLDGLHTGYTPDGKVLAEGGSLETSKLEPFFRFARRAVSGEKRFVITHSEIFPGTFASTTETADYLLREVGMTRTPVLQWGPGGMQQLSESRKGSLVVLGFAGNTAPDHLDHFHSMAAFVELLH